MLLYLFYYYSNGDDFLMNVFYLSQLLVYIAVNVIVVEFPGKKVKKKLKKINKLTEEGKDWNIVSYVCIIKKIATIFFKKKIIDIITDVHID